MVKSSVNLFFGHLPDLFCDSTVLHPIFHKSNLSNSIFYKKNIFPQLTDQAAILWEETLYKEQASGDFGPPCLVETSADDKQYVAYQVKYL